MNLEIITPEKKIFKGKVSSVKVPGDKSPFQILKNHSPIISTLCKGKIELVIKTEHFLNKEFEPNKKENKLSLNIESGVIKNENNYITILLN